MKVWNDCHLIVCQRLSYEIMLAVNNFYNAQTGMSINPFILHRQEKKQGEKRLLLLKPQFLLLKQFLERGFAGWYWGICQCMGPATFAIHLKTHVISLFLFSDGALTVKFVWHFVGCVIECNIILLLYYSFIQHRTKRWCLTIGYASTIQECKKTNEIMNVS